jgi:phospholipid N-methyltransferase
MDHSLKNKFDEEMVVAKYFKSMAYAPFRGGALVPM